MAIVAKIPKDLTKVKNKVMLNLTKRQLICFGTAAAIGFPVYYLTKDIIGTTNAATIMISMMVPAFLFAMYEKNGQHLEQILLNIIRQNLLRPKIRVYETRNIYETDIKKIKINKREGGQNLAEGRKKGKPIKKSRPE
jgi:hypothetical protein